MCARLQEECCGLVAGGCWWCSGRGGGRIQNARAKAAESGRLGGNSKIENSNLKFETYLMESTFMYYTGFMLHADLTKERVDNTNGPHVYSCLVHSSIMVCT